MSDFSTDKSKLIFGENAYKILNKYLAESNFSKVLILTDENTQTLCLPPFLELFSKEIQPELIEVSGGEENKDIATCQQLWDTLAELEADRQSLLINLGGGIITDMGGFVAATYLRGIRFINVPTTLLGMVDAAIGGKTGVNRAGLKNQIGVFSFPDYTLIDIRFLGTLAQRQLKNGLAEMLKHGLIAHKDYWKKLSDLSRLNLSDLEDLIMTSIDIKSAIVKADTRESGLRKKLNFGHSLGHAIESYCLENPHKKNLLHGEAIAIGMILESYLSTVTGSLSTIELKEIKNVIRTTFEQVHFSKTDQRQIIKLLKYDKKNNRGKINFVLLKEIGQTQIDCTVNDEAIIQAFEYYAKD